MQAIVFIIIISGILHESLAITCFDCDSIHDYRCNEYLTSAMRDVEQIDCDDVNTMFYPMAYGRHVPATGCLVKFYEGVDGQRFFVRRSCFFGDIERDEEEICASKDPYMPFTDLLACRVCTDDLCNTNNGPLKSKMSYGTLVAALFVHLLSRHQAN